MKSQDLIPSLKQMRQAGRAAAASLAALAAAAPSHAIDPVPAPVAPAPVAGAASAGLADIVARVSPSVVQIMVRQGSPSQTVAGPGDLEALPPALRDFFGREHPFFFGERRQWRAPERRGSGSGFFVEAGYIVTNNHVVDNARQLRVRLDDGTEIAGSLVGTDPRTDLAVIKVDARHARLPLAWGDSDRARVGENVFTIGAPFSLGNTVTAGIISARGRNIGAGPYDDYLQIDAPINPGNSGGPMFNSAGEVIGVNTAIFSPSGGNVGIGFSIPSQQARAIVRQIIDRGYVERGWLGAMVQQVTPEIAQGLGVAGATGALVADVTPDSPAARAGLQPMDLVTSYGGRAIASMHDLTRAVADTRPGETRELRIVRNGDERTLKVRIAPLETSDRIPKAAGGDDAGAGEETGLGLRLAEDPRGLVVAGVVPGSAAEESGLRPGDRLTTIGESDIASISDAQAALATARRTGRSAVLMQVERRGEKLFVGVPLTPG
jgi:serine protease Do